MSDQRSSTAQQFPDPTTLPTLDDLVALRDAFEDWTNNHGMIWFPGDQDLAEAIAGVLGFEMEFGLLDEDES